MSKEPEPGVIRNIPKGQSGVSDAVELFANANVTAFSRKKGRVQGIAGSGIAKCRMTASYETGVVSISLRSGKPLMVSVRLDEMMALLQAAATRATEAREEKK